MGCTRCGGKFHKATYCTKPPLVPEAPPRPPMPRVRARVPSLPEELEPYYDITVTPTPRLREALRLMLEEVRDREHELARLRFCRDMMKVATPEDVALLDAIQAWGEAIQERHAAP